MQGTPGERLEVGPGGWVRYMTDGAGAVYVRLAEDADGRLIVADVFMGFDSPPGTRTLRQAAERAARAEALANGPRYRKAVRRRLSVRGPDLRTAAAGGRWVGIPTSDDIGAMGIKVVHTDLMLEPPATRPYPAAFWRVVADVYSAAAARTSRPAIAIAAASDVSVNTVHAWVHEARKRGHLAPGRKGRAG